jgi:hypothetical protein
VRLLVSELVTNAIRHGPKAAVRSDSPCRGDTLRVDVSAVVLGPRPRPPPAGWGGGGWCS